MGAPPPIFSLLLDAISEITGQEGDVVTMQDIFVFRKLGKSETGEIIGEFVATGIRPQCMDDLVAAGIDLDLSTFLAKGA